MHQFCPTATAFKVGFTLWNLFSSHTRHGQSSSEQITRLFEESRIPHKLSYTEWLSMHKCMYHYTPAIKLQQEMLLQDQNWHPHLLLICTYLSNTAYIQLLKDTFKKSLNLVQFCEKLQLQQSFTQDITTQKIQKIKIQLVLCVVIGVLFY